MRGTGPDRWRHEIDVARCRAGQLRVEMIPLDESHDPSPARQQGDVVHALAKDLIGGVPWVGGVLAELIQVRFGPPLEARRDAWFRGLATRVSELEQRDALVPAQMQRPDVVDAFATLTRAARETSEDEKLERLRNALLNTDAGPTPATVMAEPPTGAAAAPRARGLDVAGAAARPICTPR